MEKPIKKVVKKPAKKPVKPKIKRGDKLTDELFNKIINRLSFSELGLVSICKEVGLSPQTFYNGMEGNEKRVEIYTRARELQADFLFDEQRSIVYKREQDHTPFTGGNVIQRDKLIAETLKWQMSKLKPKKYGDKLEVEQKTELTGKIEHTITGMQIVNSEKIEPGE